jgi:hypothetical protein
MIGSSISKLKATPNVRCDERLPEKLFGSSRHYVLRKALIKNRTVVVVCGLLYSGPHYAGFRIVSRHDFERAVGSHIVFHQL